MLLSKSQDMFICSTLGAVNEDNNLVLHFMDLQKGLFKFLWVLKLAGLKMKSQIKWAIIGFDSHYNDADAFCMLTLHNFPLLEFNKIYYPIIYSIDHSISDRPTMYAPSPKLVCL